MKTAFEISRLSLGGGILADATVMSLGHPSSPTAIAIGVIVGLALTLWVRSPA